MVSTCRDGSWLLHNNDSHCKLMKNSLKLLDLSLLTLFFFFFFFFFFAHRKTFVQPTDIRCLALQKKKKK